MLVFQALLGQRVGELRSEISTMQQAAPMGFTALVGLRIKGDNLQCFRALLDAVLYRFYVVFDDI